MAVSISLADDIDISRGDLIARPNNQPRVAQDFDATVCWMADDPRWSRAATTSSSTPRAPRGSR